MRIPGTVILLTVVGAGPVTAGPALPGPESASAHGTWAVFRTVPDRTRGPAVYDPARQRMIVIGGASSTWALATPPGSEAWTRLDVGFVDSGVLEGQAVALDPAGDRALQFGGYRPGQQPMSELWELTFDSASGWRRVQTQGATPPARLWGTMIHDALRQRMLLFGGSTWDRSVWTLTLDETPTWNVLDVQGVPPPAGGYKLVHDIARDRVYALGGPDGGDLWTFDISSPVWRRIETSVRPTSPDGWGVLIHDPLRSRLVAIQSNYSSSYGDPVWAFSIEQEQWTSWRVDGGFWPPPVPRLGFSAIHDPVADRILLHAGQDRTGNLNDTWELRLGDRGWRELELAPRARWGHEIAFDADSNRLLVVGGSTSYDWYYRIAFHDGRLWQLMPDAGARWSVAGHPGMARSGHVGAFDPMRDGLVVVGGYSMYYPGCHPQHDPMLPSYALDAWSLATNADGVDRALPSGAHAQDHALAHDRTGDRVFTFGGLRIHYVQCDHVAQVTYVFGSPLQVLDLDSPSAWITLVAEGDIPPAQSRAILVHDEDLDRLVLVGGNANGQWQRNQVWTLDLRQPARWYRHEVAGDVPSGEFAAFYDPVRERIVGYDLSDRYGSMRVLSLRDSMKWERLAPAGSAPSRLRYARVAYDSKRDRMFLLGETTDVWALTWGDPLTRVQLSVGDLSAARIEAGRAGHVRIAVLSTTDFDAASIDPVTIVVQGGTLVRSGGQAPLVQTIDVDRDRDLDLVMHVDPDLPTTGTDEVLFRIDARTATGALLRGSGYARLGPTARMPVELLEATEELEFAVEVASPRRAPGGRVELVVTLPGPGPVEAGVFDVAGRRMGVRRLDLRDAGRHEITVEAPGLRAGVYFIRVRLGDLSAVRRFILLP